MGYFRIHERIKILPGVHVNLGKRGVSLSLGEPGATWNIGPKGQRTTIGIPGTGISYVEQSKNAPHLGTGAGLPPRHHRIRWMIVIIVVIWAIGWLTLQ